MWCLICGWSWLSVGVVFICVEAVAVVVVWVWMLVVVCGCLWSCMGGLDHLCVDGCHVKEGVAVGDGGAVIVVVPCHPGMWVFVGLKVTINVLTWHAHKLCMPRKWFCGGAVCWAPPPSWL